MVSAVTLIPRTVYADEPLFAQAVRLGRAEATQSMAVGDMNGDGWFDIIQGNDGQSYVYLNDGWGSFTQRIPWGRGETTNSVAVGDLNGDGFLDIVQGNEGQSYIYLNDGQENFASRAVHLVMMRRLVVSPSAILTGMASSTSCRATIVVRVMFI